MSEDASPTQRSDLPFADKVRLVPPGQPRTWLVAGWRDFRAGGAISLAHGLLFVCAGVLLTEGLIFAGLAYLIAPLIAGFMLVGPALTVGFYAISRDLEDGLTPSFSGALAAWRANPAPLLGMGLLLVIFLIVWMRFAAMIFAIFFPFTGLDIPALVQATLLTTNGLTFLLVGTIVGAGMASIAFTVGAFSLPLLLDRRVGLFEALVTSAVAVVLNARAMVVWAFLVVLLTGIGFAAGFIGLAVTLPVVGHATWHAYRGVIRG